MAFIHIHHSVLDTNIRNTVFSFSFFSALSTAIMYVKHYQIVLFVGPFTLIVTKYKIKHWNHFNKSFCKYFQRNKTQNANSPIVNSLWMGLNVKWTEPIWTVIPNKTYVEYIQSFSPTFFFFILYSSVVSIERISHFIQEI